MNKKSKLYRYLQSTRNVIAFENNDVSNPGRIEIVNSIREAARRGLKYCLSKSPCKRGHYGPRYSASAVCVQCKTRVLRQRWGEKEKVVRARKRAVQLLLDSASDILYKYICDRNDHKQS